MRQGHKESADGSAPEQAESMRMTSFRSPAIVWPRASDDDDATSRLLVGAQSGNVVALDEGDRRGDVRLGTALHQQRFGELFSGLVMSV